MDEEREGGDQMEQFHRNEAISAVADDGFLGEEGEEEEDDYEDLYNDVNVGEGFLQTLRKNDDVSGFNDRNSNRSNVEEEKKVGLIANPVGGATVGESNNVNLPTVSGGHFENSGTNQNGPGGLDGPAGRSVGSGGPLRVEFGQGKVKNNVEEQVVGHINSNINGGGGGNYNGSSGGGAAGAGADGVQGGVGRQMLSGGGGGNEGLMRQGGGVGFGSSAGRGGNVNSGGGNSNSIIVGNAGGGAGGGTILFVGDLHWWTTDAELEAELSKYGHVKEVKFFDEKASGKSKGYCQAEFYDPAAATACKENMNGHVFNGRPCVVAFASPYSVKRMGEAQVNRNQQMGQGTVGPARRGVNDGGGRTGPSNIPPGGNYQGGDSNRGGYGRGNWGRGRGPGGQMRGRGPGGVGGRGIMGNGGNAFGQGIGGAPPMMHPQSMGFDPGFGAPMGRMGGYGGFPGAPTPPFSGVLSSFPHVGGIGLPGVAPHINPAFFNNRMPMNGMGGMMPGSGVEGPNMGMWSDPSMGGWAGDEQGGGRARESSYGEEAASDLQYDEVSNDRGGWQNPTKEKDRISDRDWPRSSERRYLDDREVGFDRGMPVEKEMVHDIDRAERRHQDDGGVSRDRERVRNRSREHSRDRDRDRERDRDKERERYGDDRARHGDHHRYKDREPERDEEWDRGRSSRAHSKSRMSQEDEHHMRSRDADYGKRRRLTPE